MLGSTRTVRSAILGFSAVALLVLSGLSWATVVSLQLDRATQAAQAALRERQAQKDLRNRLEIARLRMDGIIWPVLIREISRPYREYGAYYYDDDIGEAELKESPLRRGGTESWIALYFQVTEELCWTSPQLTPCARRIEERPASHANARAPDDKFHAVRLACACVEADATDPAAGDRKNLLDRLAQACTPEFFAERIAVVREASTNGAGGGTGESPPFGGDGDPHRRHSPAAHLQQKFLPPRLECEPTRQVLQVTGRELVAPTEDLEKEYYPVRVNQMTALELPSFEDDDPKLALVRRVDIGTDRVFQGLVVDLTVLTQALAPRVCDLFDQVHLEMDSASLDLAEGSTKLGSLPVRLVVPEPRIPAQPPHPGFVHTTVAFAWTTALIALAAIGLGVKRLVSLTERRREFTYAVTHELRTPLTTFQLYTDMLAANLVPDSQKPFYLETLNRESRRLADLITEVLEFSRIENDAVRAHMQAHNVGELLKAIRERYEAQCRAAGLSLAMEADKTADRSLYTDPQLALQILGTLIDNACKYAASPSGATPLTGTRLDRGSPTVQLRVFETDGKLAIEVVDNGPGISPQDRPDLFKPFRRGRQPSVGRAGGVGLGLALAKHWTRLLRGQLELIDRPAQRGACFRLTLPARPS